MLKIPSPKDIVDAQTHKYGGWNRKQLREWGVPWPPPKGWRKKLEQQWEELKKPWAGEIK